MREREEELFCPLWDDEFEFRERRDEDFLSLPGPQFSGTDEDDNLREREEEFFLPLQVDELVSTE